MGLLLGFTLWGARRGLVRALTGLVVASLALFGAGFVASALSEPAAKVIAPVIEARVEAQVEEAIAKELSGHVPGVPPSLEELLGALGLDEGMRASLEDRARETIRETGASAVTAVVENMARSILYRLLYALSFAVLTAVLHTFAKGLKLVFRLPGLRGLNTVGGGLLGFLEGALLVFLAAWVLRLVGASFASGSQVVALFTTFSLDHLAAFLPLVS